MMLRFIVPSGIGDFVWLYSKLVNLDAPMDVGVVTGGSDPRVAERLFPFARLLSRVHGVTGNPMSTSEVLVKGDARHATASGVRARASRSVPMPIQANHHLEAGKRIESFIPDLPTSYHFPIDVPTADILAARSRVPEGARVGVIYAAHENVVRVWGGWTAREWAQFIPGYQAWGEFDAIVLVGAGWDVSLAREIVEATRTPIIDTTGALSIGAVVHILRTAAYCVGFPSGIPILAATVETPTYMFYPKHLEPMHDAWADPRMIADETYKASQFCAPSGVLGWLRERTHLVRAHG